ncbi:MAG: universal stress protein [Cyclobacteriaceae bacterium]
MKKILCPTDFSESAKNAIAYAAKLAQVTNCSLYLLHVQSVFDITPVELVLGKNLSLEAASESLERDSLEISRAFKIRCYAEVEESSHKLSAVIKERSKTFDLIVMGSNGPDDLYQFFGGSNTYNAIVKADVPVLLIPEGYEYSEIKSIIYAFDYFRERDLPLNHLLPFIKVLKCDLKVLQVMEESYSSEAESDLHDVQRIIKDFFAEDLTITYDTIRAGDIPQSINSYTLGNQPDVLALCSGHRSFLGNLFHKSVTRHITAICNYPVFIFHQ